ncbi:hypothetical protein KXD40_009216 [Peronospora effusa]|uniref:Uncharacterized protein n=1 Tax=Peronospora effusa TaxID=542832 RepID=A0A3M6VTM2_9STRA|nr:hypothetical protein DD238_000999 [Peronospora effusa]RQM12276.1 hypothetical protein DD237_005715 [Peronospora effusa]UIZ28708.1 hypothetical protein KXD40_009216 [Peronospora effusa]
MKNQDFVLFLLRARKASKVHLLPLQHLAIAAFTPLIRYVLPIAADIKFRLLHNALGFRYKFCWRTLLFSLVFTIAEYYLLPLQSWVDGAITWSHILFLSSLPLLPSTLQLFGIRSILIVLNIVRCCVLHSLWLHRNKRLYNSGTATNAAFVVITAMFMRIYLQELKQYAVIEDSLPAIKVEAYISFNL